VPDRQIRCPECNELVAKRHPDGIRQFRSHLAMKVLDPICPRAIIFTCSCGCEFDASGQVMKSGRINEADHR